MLEKHKLTRMSIDINSKDHKKLKVRAAKEKKSIRDFVISCLQEKLHFQCENIIASKNNIYKKI